MDLSAVDLLANRFRSSSTMTQHHAKTFTALSSDSLLDNQSAATFNQTSAHTPQRFPMTSQPRHIELTSPLLPPSHVIARPSVSVTSQREAKQRGSAKRGQWNALFRATISQSPVINDRLGSPNGSLDRLGSAVAASEPCEDPVSHCQQLHDIPLPAKVKLNLSACKFSNKLRSKTPQRSRADRFDTLWLAPLDGTVADVIGDPDNDATVNIRLENSDCASEEQFGCRSDSDRENGDWSTTTRSSKKLLGQGSGYRPMLSGTRNMQRDALSHDTVSHDVVSHDTVSHNILSRNIMTKGGMETNVDVNLYEIPRSSKE